MEDEMNEREKARLELEEILSKPFPKKSQAPPKDAEVYQMFPGKRRWVAHPVAASAYVPYEPTFQDELMETQRAVAQAARRARVQRDEFGLGHWGFETLDELVRRQNGDD
jgi:hypothetical protein